MAGYRIGTGFDVHRLVEGRRLVIGGIEIPFEKGLDGHSDADVLLHAIADALLGAAGLPDIGHYFPPSDMKYKDMDSRKLLAHVRELIERAGFERVVNVDSVVMAEEPKLASHIQSMKAVIARILGIQDKQVGIKATTTEALGTIGRGEGIAASAVCLVSSRE